MTWQWVLWIVFFCLPFNSAWVLERPESQNYHWEKTLKAPGRAHSFQPDDQEEKFPWNRTFLTLPALLEVKSSKEVMPLSPPPPRVSALDPMGQSPMGSPQPAVGASRSVCFALPMGMVDPVGQSPVDCTLHQHLPPQLLHTHSAQF